MNRVKGLFSNLTRTNPIANLLYDYVNGQPVFTDHDFKKRAKASYGRNATAYACVSLLAQSVAGIKWRVYKGRYGAQTDEREVFDHKLNRLLAKPNPEQGWAEFAEHFVSYYLLGGNAVIDIESDFKDEPVALWSLRPDRIHANPGKNQTIDSYTYSIQNATTGDRAHNFLAKDIIHIRGFNPAGLNSDFWGQAPIEPAMRYVDSDNSAVEWNVATFQNGTRPPGILAFESQQTDQQISRIKTQLRQEYTGSRQGTPMVTYGKMTWIECGRTALEMDFLNGRMLNMREICRVFKIPPQILGDGQTGAYANYSEARKAFYQEGVLPL